jgi:hypothetical protein
MKGDYSQPGLMPGRYLEQIDLPSAYLGPCFPPLSLLSAELSYAEAHFAPVSKQERGLTQGKAKSRCTVYCDTPKASSKLS